MKEPKHMPSPTFPVACALAAVLCIQPLAAKSDQPSFAARRVFNTVSYPAALAVGDFNKDGLFDLAVASMTYPGGVSVLLGNGDGTFQPAVTYTNVPFLTAITAVDINHDTNLDLVAGGLGEGAWVMLGNCARRWKTPISRTEKSAANFSENPLLHLQIGK